VTHRRMFQHDPPSITFTKDHRQLVHGDLLPGRSVTIIYDAERLPHERSQHAGRKAWTIKCFYKFVEHGEVRSIDMWSETGHILTKISTEPGEGTMMTGRVELPPDADHLTLWFLNTGKSGAHFWDSNYGRNYLFRFVVQDLDTVHASVEDDPHVQMSHFRIDVLAGPEVHDVVVLYRIMNDPAAPRDQDARLVLRRTGAADGSGKVNWSGATPVPRGAVVRFTLVYQAYGNLQTDSNSRRGYLTWKGAVRNREAGVV
jgi:Family of unknown function (DUF6209)